MDIATAFDIALEGENEMKFQALKNLHAKKIKQLMTSVDNSQKEIVKLKALNKDNMRTQMIQALRKKIRDIELVVDVMKQEFQYKTEMTGQEVNEFIMRKTLGGPKRFRPLTREELEGRITELEKKLGDVEKKLQRRAADGTGSKPTVQAKPVSAVDKSASAAAMNLSKMAQKEAELDELQNAVAVKDHQLAQLREETQRLRARNHELLVSEEELEITELQNDELKAELGSVKEELDNLTRQMITYHEEFIQNRSDNNMETELKHIDNENLQEQCDKLLKYNASLLKRMAELEVELEQNVAAHGEGGKTSKSDTSALEAKVGKLQVKLRAAEEKMRAQASAASGESSAGEVFALKDTLREKNEQIRELTKQLNGKGSPVKDSGQSKRLQQRVAELESQLRESEEDRASLRAQNADLVDEVADLRAELAMFDEPAHSQDGEEDDM